MKIDFIISSLQGGGAERVLSIIANNFAKKNGYKITLITLLNDASPYEFDNSIQRVSLTKNKKLLGHTLGSIISLSLYYKNRKNRPDIIISLMTLNNLIAILSGKLYGIKVMAQEHTNHHRNMEGRKYISLFTKKYVYKLADIVTVLTNYDIDYYRSNGVNVAVLPNPCSFKPVSKISIKKEKTILAIGTLDRYQIKGFDNLIQLIAPVLNKHKNWVLKIAGSGDQGLKVLRNLALQFKIDKQVEFVGFVNDIPKLIQDASIFVLSSRTEGLPMGLIEAMSQGIACIAFDCVTGPSDIISHNIDGILINNQDKLEMSKGIEDLMNNETKRFRLASNAIRNIKRYEITQVIELYEQIFKQFRT